MGLLPGPLALGWSFVDDADVIVQGDTRVIRATTAAGDLNGDGYRDLVVPHQQVSPPSDSHVDIFFGPIELPNLAVLASDATVDIDPIHVESSGDFDADGFDDLVVGAPYEPFPLQSGRVYLLYGPLLGAIDKDADGAISACNPGFAVNRFGMRIAVVDVNHDNVSDLLVGAAGTDTYVLGEVTLILGQVGGGKVQQDGLPALDRMAHGALLAGLHEIGRAHV